MVTPTFVNGQHKVVDLNTDDFNVIVKHLTKLFNDNHEQDDPCTYSVVALFKMTVENVNVHITLTQRVEYQLNNYVNGEEPMTIKEVMANIKSLLNGNGFSRHENVSKLHANVFISRKAPYTDEKTQLGVDSDIWTCI